MTGWSTPDGSDPASAAAPSETAATPSYGVVPPAGYGGGYGQPGYGQPGYGPAYGANWPPPRPSAPRPGIVPLRPLGLGELLDGSFTAIRTAPLASLGISAIFMLAYQAIFLLLNYTLLRRTTTVSLDGSTTTTTSDAVARVSTTYIAEAVLTSILLLGLTGVMAAIVGERVVGRRVTFGEARRRLRATAGPLTKVVLAVTGIVAGTVAVALAPAIAAAAVGATGGAAALLALGLLALAVPVIYVWVTLSLAPAVIVLERQGVRAALRRSRKLVQGSWWRVFWISLLAWLISYVVSSILAVPFLIGGGGLTVVFAGHSNNLSFYVLLLSAVGGFIGGTLARPFQAGVTALLYVDRRMRAEGLDLALHQAANDATTAS